MSTDEFALYDAAYVLGSLSPAERRDFETHLKGCADCASSVGALAGLPGLMSKVSVEDLTAQIEAPPEMLLPSLARAVRRERGRRRLALGGSAVAAACLVAVGALALPGPASPAGPLVVATTTSSSSSSGTSSLVLTAVVPSPVTASARLVDMAWGTRIDLTCAYDARAYFPDDVGSYALVVIDRSGAAQQVATWKALANRKITVMGASSLARQDIATVEIRTLSGRAILRLST